MNGLRGEYFRNHLILISDTLPPREVVGTMIHEAQHHAGIRNDDKANAAIFCFAGAPEDEQDEEEDDDGNGGTGRPVAAAAAMGFHASWRSPIRTCG